MTSTLFTVPSVSGAGDLTANSAPPGEGWGATVLGDEDKVTVPVLSRRLLIRERQIVLVPGEPPLTTSTHLVRVVVDTVVHRRVEACRIGSLAEGVESGSDTIPGFDGSRASI